MLGSDAATETKRQAAQSRTRRAAEGVYWPDQESHEGQLQLAVLTALVRSGYAGLAGIGCEVASGRVTLFGAVPTYHLKQLAQVFAQRVDGVRAIQNRIAVLGG